MKVIILQKLHKLLFVFVASMWIKIWYSLKVYLDLTAFLVWFVQRGHRNPTVAVTAATGKISVGTTGLEVYCLIQCHTQTPRPPLTACFLQHQWRHSPINEPWPRLVFFSYKILNKFHFTGWRQPHAQPPTWRTRLPYLYPPETGLPICTPGH
jgi:hypothetical protein